MRVGIKINISLSMPAQPQQQQHPPIPVHVLGKRGYVWDVDGMHDLRLHHAAIVMIMTVVMCVGRLWPASSHELLDSRWLVPSSRLTAAVPD